MSVCLCAFTSLKLFSGFDINLSYQIWNIKSRLSHSSKLDRSLGLLVFLFTKISFLSFLNFVFQDVHRCLASYLCRIYIMKKFHLMLAVLTCVEIVFRQQWVLWMTETIFLWHLFKLQDGNSFLVVSHSSNITIESIVEHSFWVIDSIWAGAALGIASTRWYLELLIIGIVKITGCSEIFLVY